jgi:hypothetical protein
MNEEEEKVAKTLLAIGKKHNKGYVFVSQATLQVLLKKYQDWNRSERTLRRRIKDLEAKGFIKVIHRNWSEVNGSRKYRCNLYKFTRKLFEWFQGLGEYVRKLFSHFHRPNLANYSFKPPSRDLGKAYGNVEILWKSPEKGRASPSQGIL